MSEQKQTRSYKDLLVWQKGIVLVRRIYQVTRPFPPDEKFGIISQMRRAAVSIPSNVAEGQARRTTGEFVQSLSHAEGSVAELETQLIISTELGYCSPDDIRDVLERISELKRMLNALRRQLLRRK
ncbi:MAG: four helix bundle protein [Nitrospirae bacterium]|nr:four helix bundle protein [Nitrospirota bacterium]